MSQFCPECGTENLDAAKFCKNCGFNLLEALQKIEQENIKRSQANQNANNTSSNQNDSYIYFIVLFVAFLCAIFYYVLYYDETKFKSVLEDAKNGHSFAQYELAMIYANGKDGVDKNNSEAAKWLVIAASNGHVLAKSELCNMGKYSDKWQLGIEIDHKTFNKLCQKQALDEKTK